MLLLCLLVALAAWLVYTFKLKGLFSYWTLRGVPGPKTSAPFGSYTDVFLGRKSNNDFVMDVYKEYRNERFVGTQFATCPLLQVHDPDIIRQVFVKEFQDFNGRGVYHDTDKDFLSANLFSMDGTPWRNMRVKLSPTFTTGKLKYMFNLIKESGVQLEEHLSHKLEEGKGRYSVDIKDLASRFTIDIITSVTFGVQSNSLTNPDSEFRTMGHRLLNPSLKFAIRSVLSFFWPGAMKTLGLRIFDTDVSDYFARTVWDVVEYREKNGVERPDMLNLLMKLKNEGYVPPDSGDKDSQETKGAVAPENRQEMTLKELAAQCVVFFTAGYETSASTILFSMYLLAKNRHIQDRMTNEMRESLDRHGGKLSYEVLMDLPYTDMVINETLRMFPPVPFVTREAMRDRTLPTTDVMLEKGQKLIIPVHALHMDPQYWENPEEFNPERFTKENVANRTPMTYLPFGDGPRLCIGMRMAMVQVKMALLCILSKVEVLPSQSTPDNMVLSPKAIIPTPATTLMLDFRARDRGMGSFLA